ncbi:MAG: shikimate dehydrogenase [Candidatus Peregrinibacteria bacterium]
MPHPSSFQRFGILAYPASHSLSPALHTAGFLAWGFPGKYERFEIAPENLDEFFAKRVMSGEISGLSVSVPHKEVVIKYLDTLNPAAQKIGAVNTIFWRNGKLVGDNTDGTGFLKSLTEKFEIRGKTALVLGAGGATRAILYALENAGVSQIFLWNRTVEKAQKLAEEFKTVETHCNASLQNPKTIDLVINTTSLGMTGAYENESPIPKTFWNDHHTALDIVYTPQKTRFLREAESAGAKIISGEKMFLYQGMAQFEIFTGLNAPEEEMENCFCRTVACNGSTKTQKILHRIVKEKWKTISDYKKTDATTRAPTTPRAFYNALLKPKKGLSQTPHLIAEIKPASPSQGKLFRETDTVEDLARLYTENGASAISVLTDSAFFGASLENLKKARSATHLPLLRKDFIVHDSQIYEAVEEGANAVLLMKSILTTAKIKEFLELCEKLGIDALVEVHTTEELQEILEKTTAKIIGINNRDFRDLSVDPTHFGKVLAHHLLKGSDDTRKNYIFVAESGLKTAEDIHQYACTADAVLIGTEILKSENRVKKVQELAGKV